MKPYIYNITNYRAILFLLVMSLLYSTRATAQFEIEADTATVSDPVYFGYELSLGLQQHTLKSSIPQLNNLIVNEGGARIGLKIANTKLALRTFFGIYYSGGEIPYTIDMLEAGVAGNLYFLRLRENRYRTFEPYAILGVSYQRAKFYGTYLGDKNRNTGLELDQFLSDVNWLQTTAGLGVEFQMENSQRHFMHFFAEVRYGLPFVLNASQEAFKDTTATEAISLVVGISVGKFKSAKE